MKSANVTQTVAVRIVGRNNFTCTSEQYLDRGTWQSVDIQVIYKIFDLGTDEGIERRGYSGRGAGARIVVIIGEDEYDATTPEDVLEILDHRAGICLSPGSRMRAYKFRARQRRKQVWDGHNYVAGSCYYTNVYLARAQAR